MSAAELINLLSNSIIDWTFKQKLLTMLNDPEFKIESNSNEHDVSYVLGLSEIQFYTTNKGNAKTFGFQELIQSLKSKPLNEKVAWVSVLGAEWTGRCILSADERVFLGCAFVQHRREPKLVTPPKWDGSQKMLDEHNRNLT